MAVVIISLIPKEYESLKGLCHWQILWILYVIENVSSVCVSILHLLAICLHVYTEYFSYSTFLKECPFAIKIRMSQDGNRLYVKEIGGDHTHELSKVSMSSVM